MASALDLYAALGVSRDAAQAEITRAYRAAVRRYHPDTRNDSLERGELADARLQQVLAAYAVLGDPARRRAYDQNQTASSAGVPVRVQVHVRPGPSVDAPAAVSRWDLASRSSGAARGRAARRDPLWEFIESFLGLELPW